VAVSISPMQKLTPSLVRHLGSVLRILMTGQYKQILPHALSYNAPEIPSVMAKLALILPDCEGDAIRGLNILLARLKVKRGLKELGMEEEDVDKAADLAVASPYWNPRKVERDSIRELLRRAWAGEDAKAGL
jgi:alcohol dehydrogenase class IV